MSLVVFDHDVYLFVPIIKHEICFKSQTCFLPFIVSLYRSKTSIFCESVPKSPQRESLNSMLNEFLCPKRLKTISFSEKNWTLLTRLFKR